VGPVTTYSYDAAGNLISTTSPPPLGEGQGEGGNVTTYGYNALGQETSVSEPNPMTGAADGRPRPSATTWPAT